MEQASFEQLCPAESWKRVCGQGWGSNSLGFSASGLQLNWTAQLTSNPLIPRALRMPGDVTAASKDGSRICGDGAGLSSLPHRELFYSVCLVIRLRKHDWIKHWFLDVLHIRRLTKPFFSMQQVFGQIIGQQQEQVIHHLAVLWQKSGWRTKLLINVFRCKDIA